MAATGARVAEKPSLRELERIAARVRLELVRMFGFGKAHHFGGSLSCVELATAVYFYKMNYSAALSADPQRDRFIMGKGHSVPTQYVILSMLGVIPPEELKTIKQLGSRLQGHPDILKTPGIEAPTGSLGQGLSFANGIALAARMDGLKFDIYLILGDGELHEGQIWEAAMTTAHYRLGNICVLVDRNRFQSQGEVDLMKGIEPLEDKWRAFGWRAATIDGHDMGQICAALDGFAGCGEQPLAIIARTVKGKGVSFLENTYKYHNFALTEAQFLEAEREALDRLDALGST
jgi:transketolase